MGTLVTGRAVTRQATPARRAPATMRRRVSARVRRTQWSVRAPLVTGGLATTTARSRAGGCGRNVSPTAEGFVLSARVASVLATLDFYILNAILNAASRVL